MNSLRIRRGQRGLSLVELMVALAIGCFLILGITQIYIDNRRNYNFQQQQAGNQENQRFLVTLMESYLNKVGFRRTPAQLPEYAFRRLDATTDCEAFKPESSITRAQPDNGTVGVCLRYFPLVQGELDCTGKATPNFEGSDKAYSLKGDPVVMVLRFKPDDNGGLNGKLECKAGNTTAELVTGIADFRMAFGVGEGLDRKIDRVVKSTDYNGTGYIMQVRFNALMASSDNQRPDGSDSLALTTWTRDATTAEKAWLTSRDKGQIFQIASSNVALRNVMP
ncbi:MULTISPECIES: prepilin-type N-terminal cleavage/methylation domain-containing protein [Pseudomonas]|uniref:PilW family protein n=1 Tax=Pseudomonas TaxID=286 RepID=UPI001C7E5BA3|nr:MULTISPECIES: prepilin-type N-terminal cleavage/methylation domain-containing protein [Pseudomonas]MDG9928357.1 prepilin-type N-terminal cleavage/methylation domain-containing protein [Pseudomonas sp. GD04042]MDH0481079.1 prepilin-type N-terminal cleavage/methylation domain-containing protein [Pseudomonas sp. GD04015]MDH0604415.1 prepilin-type N-terminal cleavage/methylation domain-containing protein [Pseudomonas sp. GD03869]